MTLLVTFSQTPAAVLHTALLLLPPLPLALDPAEGPDDRANTRLPASVRLFHLGHHLCHILGDKVPTSTSE